MALPGRLFNRIERESDNLSKITGVPVVSGYNDNENGYTRYDFNEPLSDEEIEEIDRAYGIRFFSLVNFRQAFIKR